MQRDFLSIGRSLAYVWYTGCIFTSVVHCRGSVISGRGNRPFAESCGFSSAETAMARNRRINQKLLAASASSNGSLSDWAYERILDLVLEGSLAAGAVLQERRIAEALSISRTPVREALSRLEAEGLVTRQIGRLMTVTEITVQQYIDVLNVRKILETEAAGLAAGQVSSPVIEKMRKAVEDLTNKDNPTASEHWAVDDLIHLTIAAAAKNQCLETTIRDLRRRTRIFNTHRIPGRLRPGAAEHLALIDAIARGDQDQARDLMAKHIQNVKLSIIDQLTATGRTAYTLSS